MKMGWISEDLAR